MSINKRRVVITGLGTINPIGGDTETTWKAIKEGKCGIGEIKSFDTADFLAIMAAEIQDFHPETLIEKQRLRKMARFTQMALYASIEAYRDAGFGETLDEEFADRFGVMISSGIGALQSIEAEDQKCVEKGYLKVSPSFIPTIISNMAAGTVAIEFGLKGMCSCPVTACAGGTNAVGDAFHRIRDGYEDAFICGGSEACISPLSISAFAQMNALSKSRDPKRACIPFDAERGGFVMGEGCGLLVLEEMEHALARNAKIYGEIVGYASNCDAFHITAPAPGGAGAVACMNKALKDADIKPEDIDYINTHGTGTPLNDKTETAAVKTVFGSHAEKLALSSTKSMTGHLLGAAGGVEALISTLAVKEGYIPATIGYEVADPECDLDIVPNEGRNADLRYAMSNSLGFGGHNAAVIIGRWDR